MAPIVRKRLSPADNELTKNVCPSEKKKNLSENARKKSVKSKGSKRKSSSPTSRSESRERKVTENEKSTKPETSKAHGKKRQKLVEEEAPSQSDINGMDVAQLLALGESSHTQDVVQQTFSASDFSESDDSDFEEVTSTDLRHPEIPKEGVNITVELPQLRRKVMGIDAATIVKREMNRVKKGLQLMMHKVHVLCWLAHIKFVNTTINSSDVMNSSMSLIKSKNLYPPKHSDLNYLEGILKWYHKTIQLEKSEDQKCTGGLLKELIYQIQMKRACTPRYYTLIFITLLRVLGLQARIVMSFQVVPVKPPTAELFDYKTEKGKAKESQAERVESVKEQGVKDMKAQKSSKTCENDKAAGPRTKSEAGVSDNKNSDKSKMKKDSGMRGNQLPSSKKGKESQTQGKTQKPNSKSKGKSVKDDKADNYFPSDDDEDDFVSKSLSKKKGKKKSSSDQTASNSDDNSALKKREGCDVWAEVFVEDEEKWISVDVPKQKIHCINELYSRATHPITYIIACNNNSTLKDVTKRYVPHWHSDTRKRRVDEEWWNATMRPYLPTRTARDKEEDEEIAQQLHDKPLPSTISEFKDHPLYALKRHLLKFEAIYPPDAPTLGFVRGEPVYARECVAMLHSREMWYKQARMVRLKEDPYKIVKARPKYDKMTGEVKKDLPLELFGIWQTEEYIPPVAVDGKVPRNEYGNVDLFKPCMLPIGTVHLQIPGLNKVARKLGIDCVPATVGFDFHSGGSHPVFDGFVVCQEFKDVLLDTWNKEIDESAKKSQEKREKVVYGNWRRLIRGLLIREKLKLKYSFGESSDGPEPGPADAAE